MDYEEMLLQVTDVLKAHNRYHMNTPDHEQAVKLIREIVTPKGYWIISKDGTYPICSLCGTRGETQYDGVEPIPKCTSYCSNCGARMEVNDAEVHGNDA